MRRRRTSSRQVSWSPPRSELRPVRTGEVAGDGEVELKLELLALVCVLGCYTSLHYYSGARVLEWIAIKMTK
jgi:hypothetical protein